MPAPDGAIAGMARSYHQESLRPAVGAGHARDTSYHHELLRPAVGAGHARDTYAPASRTCGGRVWSTGASSSIQKPIACS